MKKILYVLVTLVLLLILTIGLLILIRTWPRKKDIPDLSYRGKEYTFVPDAPLEKSPWYKDCLRCRDSAQASAVHAVRQQMKLIPAGEFVLGNNFVKTKPDSAFYFSDEYPAHRVEVKAFYLGKFEITQDIFLGIMNENPSEFYGPKLPVEQVDFDLLFRFLSRLNYLSGENYRLPSEAEWEYAARAGSRDPFFPSEIDLAMMEWYKKNSEGRTHPVGSKQPNDWGLYDMNGNVHEYTDDEHFEDYQNAPSTSKPRFGNPEYSSNVLRGGSFSTEAFYCRASNRFNYVKALTGLGFRVARDK